MTLAPLDRGDLQDAVRDAFDRSLQAPMWLTTVLRPAGPVDEHGAQRLVAARDGAATSSLVVVDLSAVDRVPRPVREALERLEARLDAADGVLLLMEPGEPGPLGLEAPHL